MKIPARNELIVLQALIEERPDRGILGLCAIIDVAKVMLEHGRKPSDVTIVFDDLVEPVRALELIEDLLGYERCGACGLRHLPNDCDLAPLPDDPLPWCPDCGAGLGQPHGTTCALQPLGGARA